MWGANAPHIRLSPGAALQAAGRLLLPMPVKLLLLAAGAGVAILPASACSDSPNPTSGSAALVDIGAGLKDRKAPPPKRSPRASRTSPGWRKTRMGRLWASTAAFTDTGTIYRITLPA